MAGLLWPVLLMLTKWESPQMLPLSLFFYNCQEVSLCGFTIVHFVVFLFCYEYMNLIIVVCTCILCCGFCLSLFLSL
jgi:hypothetical protein